MKKINEKIADSVLSLALDCWSIGYFELPPHMEEHKCIFQRRYSLVTIGGLVNIAVMWQRQGVHSSAFIEFKSSLPASFTPVARTQICMHLYVETENGYRNKYPTALCVCLCLCVSVIPPMAD